MIVHRIEHLCERPHGAASSPNTCPAIYAERPQYGLILETPEKDPTLANFIECVKPFGEQRDYRWIFGTLPEQFEKWWDNNSAHRLPGEWWHSEYEVPSESVVIGQNQVIFYSPAAIRIRRSKRCFV